MKKLVRTMCLLAMILLAVLCAGCKAPVEPAVKLAAPENLRIEGRTLCWDPVEHANGYVVYVAQAEHNVTACSFDLSELAVGDYEVEVLAVGDGKRYSDSEWVKVDYTAEEIVKRGYDETGLFFQLMEDGSGYILSRGKRDIFSEEEWILPTYYRGLPVKEIAENGFILCSPLVYPTPLDREPRYCNEVTRKMILPAYLEKIEHHAFMGMLKLEEVVIPDTVTELGKSCFYGCLRLEHITLSTSLKTIGDSCFQGCALQELTLPEGLEEVGAQAFCGVTVNRGLPTMDLTKLYIPASVKRIDVSAFKNCYKLEQITFAAPENIESIFANSFQNTAWYEAQTDGWIYIGDILYAYKGELPSSIQIPDAAKRIAGSAFVNQKGLEAVYIPDGVTFIGPSVFRACKALTEVRLPSDLIELPDHCFANCEKMATICLPDNLKVIGSRCFVSCRALTAIDLPVGLTSMGSSAFHACDSLTAIALPDGLEEISDSAFLDCPTLAMVKFPDRLKRIGKGAFANCRQLVIAKLPDSVEQIDGSAFWGCQFPKTLIVSSKITQIGGSAFRCCNTLEHVVFQNEMQKLAEGTFYQCTALQTIVLPKSLTRFYENTFEGCEALRAIYYHGTESEWRILLGSITTDPRTLHIDNATVYYYSETEPNADGNYWHYVDGEPCVWAK